MSDPFLAEIRMFCGNFAPRQWATCDGQLMPISQNTALFSLLGVNFGGDGRSTFGLPNLKSRAPMHTTQYATSPLGNYPIGDSGGATTATVNTSQMAAHPHNLMAAGLAGNMTTPTSSTALAKPGSTGVSAYQSGATNLVTMASGATDFAGGNQAHNNMQPYLTLTFIIALQGIFPQRP